MDGSCSRIHRAMVAPRLELICIWQNFEPILANYYVIVQIFNVVNIKKIILYPVTLCSTRFEIIIFKLGDEQKDLVKS